MKNKNKFQLVAVLVLVSIRFLVAIPDQILLLCDVLRDISNIASYLLLNWCFFFVGVLIFFSRKDLSSLNIDAGFLILFILGSISYWKNFPFPSGWLSIIASIGFLFFYKKWEFQLLLKARPAAAQTLLIILLLFFVGILFVGTSISSETLLSILNLLSYALPYVLLEEIIFRGLLWKILEDQHWSTLKIVVLQAILFWISHINNYADSLFFWILVPPIAIFLGIIVWRSKSIALSSIAHIFINFFLSLR